jgi:hypothetical protein
MSSRIVRTTEGVLVVTYRIFEAGIADFRMGSSKLATRNILKNANHSAAIAEEDRLRFLLLDQL